MQFYKLGCCRGQGEVGNLRKFANLSLRNPAVVFLSVQSLISHLDPPAFKLRLNHLNSVKSAEENSLRVMKAMAGNSWSQILEAGCYQTAIVFLPEFLEV